MTKSQKKQRARDQQTEYRLANTQVRREGKKERKKARVIETFKDVDEEERAKIQKAVY